MRRLRHIFVMTVVFMTIFPSIAEENINYDITFIGNTGSGDFAPYYISSNRHGILTQSSSAIIDISANRSVERDKTFSWGYGIELVANASSSTTYQRYDSGTNQFRDNRVRATGAWLQQLYGEMKLHGCYLTIGLKEYEALLMNQRLSSGDFIESGNSRPIPEVRAGFIDFQDIPFTNGWLQLNGDFSHGRVTDNAWIRDHYNYYGGLISQDTYYTYRSILFRTKPSKRFSVTIGGQCAGQYSGTTTWYSGGKVIKTEKRSHSLKDMIKMFAPGLGDETFVIGNHLGSWDFMARYTLRDKSEVKAYFQWPWEDGSGIGKMNGFDGIWGLEYKSDTPAIVTGAVAEYIDFTNQSGPIHWAPGDSPGTDLTSQATGGDDYYESMNYNGYAHYGMGIGTPFIPSPLYNLDGALSYYNSRIRGFHIGLEGSLSRELNYRTLLSHRKGFGLTRNPLKTPVENTSAMIELTYKNRKIKGLAVNCQVAVDHGHIYGDNFGSAISVSYRGNINSILSRRAK